jgi:hypothetical protein
MARPDKTDPAPDDANMVIVENATRPPPYKVIIQKLFM